MGDNANSKRVGKKILTALASTAIFFPNITKAHWHSYGSLRYRTHYSPYAFSYKHPSGLISGDLEYSPYAFSSKNTSGLVPHWYTYSPYAFSYENPSGLVSDYWFWSAPSNFPFAQPSTPNQTPTIDFNEMKRNYETGLQIRKARTEQLKEEREKIKNTIANDPARAIYEAIKEKGFKLENTLCINNKIISTNFILKDKWLLIKYWNKKEICSLLKEGKYNKIYEKYGNDWLKEHQEYLKNGWKIATVEITKDGLKDNLESLINSIK